MCEVIEIGDIKEIKCNNDYNNCSLTILEYTGLLYNNFFSRCLIKNWPCVINNVSVTWESTKNWIRDNAINYDYLNERYGELVAPVADCGTIAYNAHTKLNMTVGEYMKYLQSSKKDKLLYLKDWHLRRERPDDNFYEIPFVFASDWLNEFAVDHQSDDFMFVYIGPKDSWTPLHADVYNSYSWSVNVVGKKKWILLPPGEEEKLKDSLGNLPLMLSSEELKNIVFYEIIQEAGDAIFVPSGWYHQVVNLCNTISINHNWINSCNVEFVWKALEKSLSSVQQEIKEFQHTAEFSTQCQLILKSLFGMDSDSFITFLCYIGEKRLKQIENTNYTGFNKYVFGKNHINYDLAVISKLMDSIYHNPEVINSISTTTKENLLSIKTRLLN